MISTFKKWRLLVTPNKKSVFVSILTISLCTICILLEPLALSAAISSATDLNFQLAIIWLLIELSIVLAKNLFWHFNYTNYPQLISPIYKELQLKVVNSILYNGKALDKEKVNQVVNYDIYKIAEFADSIINKSFKFLKQLIILVVILCYNLLIGGIIVFISVIAYIIMMAYTKKKENLSRMLYNNSRLVNEKMDEIYDKQSLVESFSLETSTIMEHDRRLTDYINVFTKNYAHTSLKDNWLQIFWESLIVLTIGILVYSFINMTISLTIFLLLVNYIKTFASSTNHIYDFKLQFSEVEVAINRYNSIFVNCVEQKTDKEIDFGNLQMTVEAKTAFKVDGHAYCKRVCVKYGETLGINYDEKYRPIKYLFITNSEECKDFALLVNNINVLNISRKDFNKIFAYVDTAEEYFSDTLIKNFLVINNNLNDIKKNIVKCKLDKILKRLPNKEFTNLGTEELKLSDFEAFMLNFFRAIISPAKIIFLDINFPLHKHKKHFQQIINNYKDSRIIVISSISENNLIYDKKIV